MAQSRPKVAKKAIKKHGKKEAEKGAEKVVQKGAKRSWEEVGRGSPGGRPQRQKVRLVRRTAPSIGRRTLWAEGATCEARGPLYRPASAVGKRCDL